MEKLSGVERWLDLGLLLGLLPSTLVGIKSRHWEDSAACLREMVHGWLCCYDQVEDRGGPTLSSLVAALRDPLIGLDALASQLEHDLSSKQSASTAAKSKTVVVF